MVNDTPGVVSVQKKSDGFKCFLLYLFSKTMIRSITFIFEISNYTRDLKTSHYRKYFRDNLKILRKKFMLINKILLSSLYRVIEVPYHQYKLSLRQQTTINTQITRKSRCRQPEILKCHYSLVNKR